MIPTVAVTVTAFDQNGNPVSGGRVQAKLDRTETYNGFVVPERIEGVTNAAGVCVLQLWPNALGANGSSYQVRAYNPDTGRKYLDTTAVVPNSTCRLEQIIVAEPFPPIDASGQALIAVQAVLGLATSQRVLADESAAGATAAQQGAVAAAADALASQGTAQTSANTAATQAGVSTTQAEIATNAANTADAITADALTAAAAAAASVLALKQGAESASTASGLSATASNAAKELSEAAKVIATEEAGKAFVSAGESAASATDAAASSALITNKAEVNITTAGNVLRADGTLFKSISEVEFLQNKEAFSRSSIAPTITPRQLFAFDSFNRPDSLDPNIADSGQTWQYIRRDPNSFNRIENTVLNTRGLDILGINTAFGSVKIEATIFLPFSSNNRASLIIGKNVNNFYELDASSGSATPLALRKTINGVSTLLATRGNSLFGLLSSNNLAMKLTLMYLHNGSVNNESIVIGYLNDYPENKIVQNVTSDFIGTFPTDADVAFAGLARLTLLTTNQPAIFYDVQITRLKL
jgi:hypothetical protein